MKFLYKPMLPLALLAMGGVACTGSAVGDGDSETAAAPAAEVTEVEHPLAGEQSEVPPELAEVPLTPASPGETAASPAPSAQAANGEAAAHAPHGPDHAHHGHTTDPTIYAGVYTAAQAARGRAIQQRDCASCHSPADWEQGRILAGYHGASVYDLVDQIRMTMPMDGPGRLQYQEYTDIVAYLFQLNNVPPGASELPADEARLRAIRVEYRR
jgi:S-disulfanyl-L-cysteine oxidoreductase SoxD